MKIKLTGRPTKGFINPPNYDSKKARRLLEKSQQVTSKSTTIGTVRTPKGF